jgi:hypothetical protein
VAYPTITVEVCQNGKGKSLDTDSPRAPSVSQVHSLGCGRCARWSKRLVASVTVVLDKLLK